MCARKCVFACVCLLERLVRNSLQFIVCFFSSVYHHVTPTSIEMPTKVREKNEKTFLVRAQYCFYRHISFDHRKAFVKSLIAYEWVITVYRYIPVGHIICMTVTIPLNPVK